MGRPNPERDKIVAAARKAANPEKWIAQHKAAIKKYRALHREELNKRSQERYKQNPDKAAAPQKAWCRRNRPARARMMREWNASHPGYYREYFKKYRAGHRGEIRTRNQMRKRKVKKAFDGDIMVVVMLNKWQSQPTFICHYCRREHESKLLHVDHKTPISRGGRHALDNLARACASCNLRKNDKTEEEFLACLYA